MTETSWYHELTHNPLLILGSEMSRDEWDLWLALVNKERNFLRNSEAKITNPMFQMRECESMGKLQKTWFEPLFIGLKYNEQWIELEKHFQVVKKNN